MGEVKVFLLVGIIALIAFYLGAIGLGSDFIDIHKKILVETSSGEKVIVETPNPEIECIADQTRCVGLNLWQCIKKSNNEGTSWELIGQVPQRCGVLQIDQGGQATETTVEECTIGEERCIGPNYETCKNQLWIAEGQVIGKCGVECYVGEKCDGQTAYLCQFGKWQSVGQIDGKCGYTSQKPPVSCQTHAGCQTAYACSVTIELNSGPLYACQCINNICEAPKISGDGNYQYLCYSEYCVTWGQVYINIQE